MFHIRVCGLEQPAVVKIAVACVEGLEKAEIFGMAILQTHLNLIVTGIKVSDGDCLIGLMKNTKGYFYEAYFCDKIIGFLHIQEIEYLEEPSKEENPQ